MYLCSLYIDIYFRSEERKHDSNMKKYADNLMSGYLMSDAYNWKNQTSVGCVVLDPANMDLIQAPP